MGVLVPLKLARAWEYVRDLLREVGAPWRKTFVAVSWIAAHALGAVAAVWCLHSATEIICQIGFHKHVFLQNTPYAFTPELVTSWSDLVIYIAFSSSGIHHLLKVLFE